ncbi:MAG: hypothetical protein LBN95_13350 [Prevotellaceae bacterium]|jgi:uncharacterized protein (TIGR02145 family)|nr:hypothetical protein [Prevotellaceae bacterium]
MKKLITIFIIAVSFAANSNAQLPKIVTTPAEKPKTTPAQTPTNKPARTCNSEAVMINGVCWAKTNLGASSPTEYGNYYTWEEAKNACPAGWRLPTKKEIDALCNENKVSYELTTQNGVKGGKFTDKNTGKSLFLPAAGFRQFSGGTLYSYRTGEYGHYWSSMQFSSDGAYCLIFSSSSALASLYKPVCGFFVRCTAE